MNLAINSTKGEKKIIIIIKERKVLGLRTEVHNDCTMIRTEDSRLSTIDSVNENDLLYYKRNVGKLKQVGRKMCDPIA